MGVGWMSEDKDYKTISDEFIEQGVFVSRDRLELLIAAGVSSKMVENDRDRALLLDAIGEQMQKNSAFFYEDCISLGGFRVQKCDFKFKFRCLQKLN